MRDLIHNILSENYVAAEDSFNSHMNEIIEKKMFEIRKNMQAEAFGGMTKQDIERRKKAGFIKAADYFGAMEKLKDIKRKAESDINPIKKKKKLTEAYTGTGSGSPEELEKRAKGAAQRLGGEVKSAAEARKARIEREIQKRKQAGKEGKPYTKPAEEKPGAPGAPSGTTKAPRGFPAELKGTGPLPKKLSAKSAAKPMGDRYSSAMDRAERLERRGRAGAVAKVKKAYAGYRRKEFAKGALKTAGAGLKGAIDSLPSVYEE